MGTKRWTQVPNELPMSTGHDAIIRGDDMWIIVRFRMVFTLGREDCSWCTRTGRCASISPPKRSLLIAGEGSLGDLGTMWSFGSPLLSYLGVGTGSFGSTTCGGSTLVLLWLLGDLIDVTEHPEDGWKVVECSGDIPCKCSQSLTFSQPRGAVTWARFIRVGCISLEATMGPSTLTPFTGSIWVFGAPLS